MFQDMAELLSVMISKFLLSIFKGVKYWPGHYLASWKSILLMINNSAMHLPIVLKFGTLVHYGLLKARELWIYTSIQIQDGRVTVGQSANVALFFDPTEMSVIVVLNESKAYEN